MEKLTFGLPLWVKTRWRNSAFCLSDVDMFAGLQPGLFVSGLFFWRWGEEKEVCGGRKERRKVLAGRQKEISNF
jgi:hypothetical protein